MSKVFKIFIILVFCGSAFSIENITIKGKSGNVSKPKLGVIKFANDTNNLSAVVANDFMMSGEYNVILYDSAALAKDADYIVSGKVVKTPRGNSLDYVLTSVKNKTEELKGAGLIGNNVRLAAHITANHLYKKLTDSDGIFTSKIAYATINQDNSSSIYVADYDGYNIKQVIASNRPLSSISWAPDGKSIAYVSYEKNKPIVFVQNLTTGNRYMLSNFFGSNSSPAFIDGKQLIVTLGLDDGSHLYVVPNKAFSKDTKIRLLTSYGSIDTEANVSKSGVVVFTSDYNGGPQIFITNLKGSTPKRITFGLGDYNTTARFSNDGKFITFISADQSKNYKTYVMNLANNMAYPVTNGTSRDIAPTFAPNDKLILFSSNNQMYITNVDGSVQNALPKINVKRLIDQSWSNQFN